MTEADASRDGWLRALDKLEGELGDMLVSTGSTTGVSTGSTTGVSTGSTTGVSTGSTTGEWTAPGDLGLIPADLVARARQLLAGQRELIAELENSKRATAAQLNALRKMPATRPTGASVYLDTSG
jgi:hypothetical protein